MSNKFKGFEKLDTFDLEAEMDDEIIDLPPTITKDWQKNFQSTIEDENKISQSLKGTQRLSLKDPISLVDLKKSLEQNVTIIDRKNETARSQKIFQTEIDKEEKAKIIDFTEVEKQYKSVTETQIPFTEQHIEDVIFVDKNKVIALEYIFYQIGEKKNCKILKEKSQRVGQSVESIELQDKSDPSKNLHYYKEPQIFEEIENQDDLEKLIIIKEIHSKSENQENLVQTHRSAKHSKQCIDKDIQVEGMLSQWNITETGQLQKTKEVNFKNDKVKQKYQETRTHTKQTYENEDTTRSGKMQLKLSQDSSKLFIIQQESEIQSKEGSTVGNLKNWHRKALAKLSKKQQSWHSSQQKKKKFEPEQIETWNKFLSTSETELLIWDTDSLKTRYFQKLSEKLKKLPYGKIVEANIVNNSQHLLIVLQRRTIMNGWEYYNFLLYEIKTGILVLDVSNDDPCRDSVCSADTHKNKLKLMQIMVNENIQRKVDLDNEGEEIQENAQNEKEEQQQSSLVQDQIKETQNKSGSSESGSDFYEGSSEEDKQIVEKIATPPKDIILTFFFSKMIPYEEGQNEKTVWSKIDLELKDIIQDEENEEEQMQWIETQAVKHFQKYTSDHEDFKEIPTSWFHVNNKEQHWHGQISIQSNKTFDQFSFINHKKRVFLAYDFSTANGSIQDQGCIVQQILADKETSIVSHGRNQFIKDSVQLVVRNKGEGSTASCFFPNGESDSIYFDNDHPHMHQDLMCLENDKDHSNLMEPHSLQSLTISREDQEIKLKTKIAQNKNVNYYMNKTISQRTQSMYPIQAFNIGVNKIIIQNTLDIGQQYLYFINHGLQKNEMFLNFVNFDDFGDIGFDPKQANRDLDTSSHVVFLTSDRIKNVIKVNLLFIDIYNEKCQFTLFKSKMVFQSSAYVKCMTHDQIINSFMYSTKKGQNDKNYEIKLMTQYSKFFEKKTMSTFDSMEMQTDNILNKNVETLVEKKLLEQINDDPDKISEENKQYVLNLAPVSMVYFNRKIFYITQQAGNCKIFEINPSNDSKYQLLQEIKSEYCYGFNVKEDSLYFVKDDKSIVKFEREQEKTELIETKTFYLKKRDISHFEKKSFSEVIVEDKYMIQNNKIFYLYDDKPTQQGILDMENLCLEIREDEQNDEDEQDNFLIYRNGPIQIQDSNEFMVRYRRQNQQQFVTRVYKLPDAKQQIIITDYNNKIEMSTFLDDDQILIKGEKRFITFDSAGEFINRVHYYEKGKQERHKDDQQFVEDREFDSKISDDFVLYSLSENQQYFVFDYEQKEKIDEDATSVPGLDKVRSSNFGPKSFNSFKKSTKAEKKFYIFKLTNTGDKDKIRLEYNRELVHKKMFVLQLEIDYYKTIFAEKKEGDLIEIDVKDNGDVYLFKTSFKDTDEEQHLIVLEGEIFKAGSSQSNFKIKQVINFDKSSSTYLNNLIEKDHNQLLRQIENENLLKRKSKNENIMLKQYGEKIQRLINRQENITSVQLFGNIDQNLSQNNNLLIARCGKQVKYKIGLKYENDEKDDLKEMNIKFDDEIEIIDILSTSKLFEVQIIAKQSQKQIMIIMTWDFQTNTEVSMYQIKTQKGTYPESHIVRGMNQKRNYFADMYQTIDLETNLPMQQHFNPLNENSASRKLTNVKKIYKNSNYSLCLEKENVIDHCHSRIEILIWKNIIQLGANAADIEKNTTLKNFHVVFEGTTLFHYFSLDSDVLQIIYKKYKQAKNIQSLSIRDEQLPLKILVPDKNGKTALDYARENNRSKSFNIMMLLLAELNNQYCLSKMMIKSIQFMMKQDTFSNIGFFNTALYQLPLMKETMRIQWPSDIDQFVFSSHSSIVCKDLIEKQMLHFNRLKSIQKANLNENADQVLSLNSPRANETTKVQLDPIEKDEEDQSLERVRIEIVDFNWIFEKGNAIKFLKILIQQETTTIFSMKSIQILTKFFWDDYYQPTLKYLVFIPFLGFLLTFIMLNEYVGVDFTNKFGTDCLHSSLSFQLKLMICFIFGVYFTVIEFKQGLDTGLKDFIQNKQNVFDLSCLSLNFVVQMMFWSDYYQGNTILDNNIVRFFYALGCLFMWFKFYHLMRIFEPFAHFITIIVEILIEIRVFVTSTFIVILAFANLFHVLSDDQREKYVSNYLGEQDGKRSFISSVLSMYMVSIGDYSTTEFGQGSEMYAVWIFFILASFIILIVFMNLLITVIGNKLNDVLMIQLQSQYAEQANMIVEYSFLLNLDKVFKNQKYIIHVFKERRQEISEQASVLNAIESFKKELFMKNDFNTLRVLDRFMKIEKQQRIMQSTQIAFGHQIDNIEKK